MSKMKNEYSCAFLLGNDLLGGKWKMRILWHVYNGDNRFSKLLTKMPDISEKVLFTQLNELVENTILVKTIHEGNIKKVEYELSQQSKPLKELLACYRNFFISYAKDHDIIIPALLNKSDN